jgi:uncharacterized protein YcfL
MYSFFRSLSIGAAIALVTGCTTVNSVELAQPMGRKQIVEDKRVVTDLGLNRRAKIVSVNESAGPGGLLKVQVEVLNITRSAQAFHYKFEWFDEHSNLIESPASTFVLKHVEGRESVFLGATAPNSSAKDFRLKLVGD